MLIDHLAILNFIDDVQRFIGIPKIKCGIGEAMSIAWWKYLTIGLMVRDVAV